MVGARALLAFLDREKSQNGEATDEAYLGALLVADTMGAITTWAINWAELKAREAEASRKAASRSRKR